MWLYLAIILIIVAVIIKLLTPYIKKNYDDVRFCGICYKKYSKKLSGCPHCGVGNI